MNVCVYGLWHLGSVTAACLASAGHQVTGVDTDPEIVAQLARGVETTRVSAGRCAGPARC